MNLKESFRYQNFLDTMMQQAAMSIQLREHSLKITKLHKRTEVDPAAQDVEEEVEVAPFFPNDIVINFMQWLIQQKAELTEAIGKAKASVGFDIDAAVETNKYRQTLNKAVKTMLKHTSGKMSDHGRAYKFNLEGNQMPYYYDIDVVYTEAYDKTSAKEAMREAIHKADEVSSQIDAAMINTEVEYTPVFDVNESFDDIMAEYENMVVG